MEIALNGISTKLNPSGGAPVRFAVATHPAPEIEIHIKPESGVTIYGAGTGRLDFDPVVLVYTAAPISHPIGWSMTENSGTPLPPLKPLFDYDIRDTSITLGGEVTGAS